jgi:4-amino-4-deoxy-L-arabinose transferase-like glycosyltransferase
MILRPLHCVLLLIALWAGIYLPALGSRELQGEEARRVLPGRTMLQTGEWIVPRSGGRVYNRKPPLVNWMSAAAMKLTGSMDEWTVRVPSTLMMLALVLCVYGCLRGWLGNDGALLAALITLTNIGFVEKGRLIEIEALYISLFGIALVSWLGLRWQGRDTAAWVVSGLVLGLGFLAKGPPHMIYFYGLVIGVLAAERKLRELWGWRHLLGLACFFAVWVPWAMLNSARNPLKDSGAVWVTQITHRLGFTEFDVLNYLLQIPQCLVNFLPWALLLPLCWKFAPQGDDRQAQWLRGLRTGLLWSFLLVALLPSSRPRFLLPLNVAAAVLVAEMLMRVALPKLSRWWMLSFEVLAALGFALAGAALFGAPWSYWLWLPVLILALLWVRHLHQQRKRGEGTVLGLGLVTSLALLQVAGAFWLQVVPRLLPREDLRPFVAQITERIGPEAPVILYKLDEHMWPFYLGWRCLEMADIKARPRTYSVNWLIMQRKTWHEERALMIRIFGTLKSEMPLIDPKNGNELVLVNLSRSEP